jgi:5-methylcytosine-specific restriction enzyme B
LIIDASNRANLAKALGELYFMLEYRDYPIGLPHSSESEFIMPPNIFLIGTMNTTGPALGQLVGQPSTHQVQPRTSPCKPT